MDDFLGSAYNIDQKALQFQQMCEEIHNRLKSSEFGSNFGELNFNIPVFLDSFAMFYDISNCSIQYKKEVKHFCSVIYSDVDLVNKDIDLYINGENPAYNNILEMARKTNLYYSLTNTFYNKMFNGLKKNDENAIDSFLSEAKRNGKYVNFRINCLIDLLEAKQPGMADGKEDPDVKIKIKDLKNLKTDMNSLFANLYQEIKNLKDLVEGFTWGKLLTSDDKFYVLSSLVQYPGDRTKSIEYGSAGLSQTKNVSSKLKSDYDGLTSPDFTNINIYVQGNMKRGLSTTTIGGMLEDMVVFPNKIKWMLHKIYVAINHSISQLEQSESSNSASVSSLSSSYRSSNSSQKAIYSGGSSDSTQRTVSSLMASTGATTVTGSVVSGLPSTNDKTNDKIDNKDKNDDKNNNTNKDNIDNKDNVDDKDNNNTNTDDTGVDNADRNDTNADNGNSNNNNVSPDNGNNQGNNGNSSGDSQPTVSKRVNGGSTGYGNTSSVSTGVNGAVSESSTVEVTDNSDTIDAGLDEDFSDFGKNKTYETVTSTNKVKQTSDKSTGSFVVPAIIGIGVAGALGVAGARYVKNKKGEQYYSDDDNFFSENDFSDSSDSQDETVSATDKKKGNSKYHAGSVNGLVLDEVNDADIKISNTDSREENTLDFE